MKLRQRRRLGVAIAAPLAVAAVLGTVAAAGSFAGVSSQVNAAGGPVTQTEAPAATIVNHYAVFQKTTTANDSMPALAENEPARVATRSQPTEASDLSQWATASGETICVVDRYTSPQSPGGAPDTNRACNSAASLEAEHQLIVQASLVGDTSSTTPTPGLANVVSGLAPNGVTSVTITFGDGTSIEAPVVENGFSYQIVGEPQMVSNVSWTTAAGQHYSENQ